MTTRNRLSGSVRLSDEALASLLSDWDDSTLSRSLGFIAGLMAARSGSYYAAETLRRIADALLRPRKGRFDDNRREAP
jgi:hypothetical protein